MGNECQRFLKHLADKIAQKDTEPYHIVITWLRTQVSFELLRSIHACVRGSRTPFRSKIEQSLDCKIGSLRKPRRQRQRERRETKGLMSRIMTVHVRYNSWYIP